jgi:alkylation response protein AidB-like acyl-CoA dehydrogenase
MPSYKAPLEDMRFVLDEVIGVDRVTSLPGYADATPDVIAAVLEEAAALCENVLFPINQSGDAEGVRLENGAVRTPAGFKEAYRAFAEGGWPGLAAVAEYGGQGLPHVVGTVFNEMLCSANLSFSMYPLLAHGAYSALMAYGSDELKERYLPKLVDGTWGGTMCLTEAHAGTDLGMIRTRAVPAGDGAYKLTGSKIFISAGEHDLTENIVHLVLAKLPDAPPGTKGISMFIVPKYLPTDEGRPGTFNNVSCGSIEHKMGIKASATCVINFDDATGWLVGEPHKGMRAMFVMMNSARLGVGIQGLGLAEVAYQNAVAYAKERLQGRSVTGAKNPAGPADPIIVHPDVRKGLLTIKAFNEAARALAYWTGLLIDVHERSADAAEREEADDFVALMTPVIKAFFTDVGYEATNIALQTYGGHGYIREFGIEQYVRDARIAQIYEGTNAVQALDLVGRKLPEGNGRLVRRYFARVQEELAAAKGDPALQELAAPLAKALEQLQQATMTVATKGMHDPEEAAGAASDYLRLFGLVSLGHMWLKMARVAQRRLAEGGGNRAFYETKLKTARFYVTKILPQTHGLLASVQAGVAPVMALAADEF